MPLMFFSSSFPSCFLCLVLVVVSFFCESVSSNCCLPLSYFCHVPISGSSRCLASMVVWVTSCFTWLGPCTFSFTSPVSFVRFCSAVFSTCCLFLCYLVCVYYLHLLLFFVTISLMSLNNKAVVLRTSYSLETCIWVLTCQSRSTSYDSFHCHWPSVLFVKTWGEWILWNLYWWCFIFP